MEYSFELESARMLSQAVTTVWRTELGTTLRNGFNSTTEKSAYFRYLCLPQCASSRRIGPRSSLV